MAGPRRRRKRVLSAEDRELWRRVAETTRPIAAGPPDKAEPSPPPAPPEARPSAPPPSPIPPPKPPSSVRPAGRTEAPLRWSEPWDGAARRPGRVIPGIDRNTARRLVRGERAPEARLDLHGMTSDRAHDALHRFIHEASAKGLRCVLVITGKGRDESGGRGRGVLRRDTPRWLAIPPLSQMIVGVFEAHARHGGGGALYVYLRKRR